MYIWRHDLGHADETHGEQAAQSSWNVGVAQNLMIYKVEEGVLHKSNGWEVVYMIGNGA